MSRSEHALVASAMPSRFDFVNHVGHRSGRLIVEAYAGKNNKNKPLWFCRCDCGGTAILTSSVIVRKQTRSCGCLNREWMSSPKRITLLTTHGQSETPEYRAWHQAKTRCYNNKTPNFKHYGGRGISMCREWRDSFEAFYAHIGRRPSSKHSLDRFPNLNGNYEPGNVRWATRYEQMRNQRGNLMLTMDGLTMCAASWADHLKLKSGQPPHRNCIVERKLAGWSDEKALTTPLLPRRYRPE